MIRLLALALLLVGCAPRPYQVQHMLSCRRIPLRDGGELIECQCSEGGVWVVLPESVR